MKQNIENILNEIEAQGWSVQKKFFSAELIQKLNETLISLQQQGKLKQAGIGRDSNYSVEKSIRNDQINWFDEQHLNEFQQTYLCVLQQLQDALNKRFFFGLSEFEVHFALYASGAFYKRHLDQHKNQDTRVLTVITYLNEKWTEKDGGELCLYLENDQLVKVQPEAGTLVCFLSAEYEHEVLPAKRDRSSLTGWFRKQSLL